MAAIRGEREGKGLAALAQPFERMVERGGRFRLQPGPESGEERRILGRGGAGPQAADDDRRRAGRLPDDEALVVDHADRVGAVERGGEIVADPAQLLILALDAVARADQGDPRASACLDRYARRFARAIASVINIVDPDAIVLGGGLSNIARLYELVPGLWGAHVFSDRVETRLLRAAHGDASGVRGAAWLWPKS